jgi:hypothetical protein
VPPEEEEEGEDDLFSREDEGFLDEDKEDLDGEINEDLLAKEKKKLDILIECLRRVYNFGVFCVFESDSVTVAWGTQWGQLNDPVQGRSQSSAARPSNNMCSPLVHFVWKSGRCCKAGYAACGGVDDDATWGAKVRSRHKGKSSPSAEICSSY